MPVQASGVAFWPMGERQSDPHSRPSNDPRLLKTRQPRADPLEYILSTQSTM